MRSNGTPCRISSRRTPTCAAPRRPPALRTTAIRIGACSVVTVSQLLFDDPGCRSPVIFDSCSRLMSPIGRVSGVVIHDVMSDEVRHTDCKGHVFPKNIFARGDL